MSCSGEKTLLLPPFPVSNNQQKVTRKNPPFLFFPLQDDPIQLLRNWVSLLEDRFDIFLRSITNFDAPEEKENENEASGKLSQISTLARIKLRSLHSSRAKQFCLYVSK